MGRLLLLLKGMAVAPVLMVQLVACSASSLAFKQGREEARRGNWDEAVRYYQQATETEPDNIDYRMALQRAMEEASHDHVREARRHLETADLAGAVRELEMAVQYDPSNQWVQDQLAVVRRRLEKRQSDRGGSTVVGSAAVEIGSVIDPSSTTLLRLKFVEGTSLRKIFETLSKLAGVNILFDESFRDKPVSVDLVDVTFEEALDLLTRTNGLFYKVVRSSTVIVTPDE